MKFNVVKSLEQRSDCDSLPNQAVEGNLLVGEQVVARWIERESVYGCDSCDLRPAFHSGERCWVVRRDWWAASPYCASGTKEAIISFTEGIEIICNQDCWDVLFQQD